MMSSPSPSSRCPFGLKSNTGEGEPSSLLSLLSPQTLHIPPQNPSSPHPKFSVTPRPFSSSPCPAPQNPPGSPKTALSPYLVSHQPPQAAGPDSGPQRAGRTQGGDFLHQITPGQSGCRGGFLRNFREVFGVSPQRGGFCWATAGPPGKISAPGQIPRPRAPGAAPGGSGPAPAALPILGAAGWAP